MSLRLQQGNRTRNTIERLRLQLQAGLNRVQEIVKNSLRELRAEQDLQVEQRLRMLRVEFNRIITVKIPKADHLLLMKTVIQVGVGVAAVQLKAGAPVQDLIQTLRVQIEADRRQEFFEHIYK